MMGEADIRDRIAPAGERQGGDELAALEIEELNRQWREKRDVLRNAQKSVAVEEQPLLTVGAAAPPAPQAGEESAANADYTSSERAQYWGRPAMESTDSTTGDNGLAIAAGGGCLEDCRRILGQTSPNVWGSDGTTPLFAAALWDQADVVRLLLEAKADPGLPNRSGLRPTALHAGALQENGKICMLLLRAKADPQARDTKSVSPTDYASCSEGVWPHFAGVGCTRTPKDELVSKGVIRRASTALELELETAQYSTATAVGSNENVLPEFSRPGSAYVLTSKHPPRPGSAAVPSSTDARSGSRNGRRPSNNSPIDILAEGDEAAEVGGTFGAPSAGRPPLGYKSGMPPLPPSNKGSSESAAATGSLRSLGL